VPNAIAEKSAPRAIRVPSEALYVDIYPPSALFLGMCTDLNIDRRGR
jgi:hypothetical protein